MKQNKRFTSAQLILIDFIKKNKNRPHLMSQLPLVDILSVDNSNDFFLMTINNILPFDQHHPYFNNIKFIDKLIFYFKLKEDFEKCKELNNIKLQLSN